jgi:PAS domain S-box-containing protein
MTKRSTSAIEKATSLSKDVLLEETLWKAARRFQALIEYSSDIVVILDVKGYIRYSSPSAERILGYASEDLVGKMLLEFIYSEDTTIVSDIVEEILKYPEVNISGSEFRIQHCNGSWRTFAATFTNLLDNSAVNGLLVNCHDVTNRKQIEEALRQSEQRFRQVISSISDHIYVTEVTEDGRHLNLYISPNVEDLTGYPAEVFIADRSFWPAKVIHPDDRGTAKMQAAQLDMGRNSEMEYRLVRADGKVIWVRDSGKVYRDGSSRIIYGVVSDITERKQIEEQFRQSQKMEAIGRLAGGIAHDFNNLLTVIIGNCEFILGFLPANDPLRSDVERIKKTGDRAASLTRQLLAFSRKQMLQPEILDLNSIVSNMEHMLRRLIGEDIELISRLAPDLGQVKVDPGQIEQVIMNLVINARDAMPQGGRLIIETANIDWDQLSTHGHIGLKPGAYIVLAVSDTGQGMDEETKAHIFEPFFTTKEPGQGTGLGLAMVHGIVNQSQGQIWVYSEPGHGTVFKIYLPRVEKPILSVSSTPDSTMSFVGSETILLVEDEDKVRELAQRILIQYGYTVLEASQGAEALQICERYTGPIDLLITDVVMPGGMSGLQLAERLQAQRPGTSVLYMSGYIDKAMVYYSGLSPKSAFLEKPFSLNGLVQKVREILDTTGRFVIGR